MKKTFQNVEEVEPVRDGMILVTSSSLLPLSSTRQSLKERYVHPKAVRRREEIAPTGCLATLNGEETGGATARNQDAMTNTAETTGCGTTVQ